VGIGEAGSATVVGFTALGFWKVLWAWMSAVARVRHDFRRAFLMFWKFIATTASFEACVLTRLRVIVSAFREHDAVTLGTEFCVLFLSVK